MHITIIKKFKCIQLYNRIYIHYKSKSRLSVRASGFSSPRDYMCSIFISIFFFVYIIFFFFIIYLLNIIAVRQFSIYGNINVCTKRAVSEDCHKKKNEEKLTAHTHIRYSIYTELKMKKINQSFRLYIYLYITLTGNQCSSGRYIYIMAEWRMMRKKLFFIHSVYLICSYRQNYHGRRRSIM